MSPKRFFSNPPVKLKSFKNDLAPLGFYFDFFTSEDFEIPVMPIPMRIDKLTNGESTFFILPDVNKLVQLFEKLDLAINFKSFYLTGIGNLIDFAEKKYKEITYRTLKKELIFNWFEKSKLTNAEIPSLTEDFTILISEFLKSFSNIKKKDLDSNRAEYKAEFIEYCDKIINYFRGKIAQNKIQIKLKGIIKTEKLFKEKKKNIIRKLFLLK